MPRLRYHALISLLILFTAIPMNALRHSSMPRDLSGAISMLDQCVKDHSDVHERYRALVEKAENAIDTETDVDARLQKIISVADLCRAFDVDKALDWYRRAHSEAIATGRVEINRRIDMKMSSLLPVSGVVKEAVDIHSRIPVDSLDRNDKILYYESANRLYMFCEAFYQTEKMKHKYHSLAESATDSLLEYLDHDTPRYNIYYAQCLSDDGNRTLAKTQLLALLDEVDVEDNLYARAASTLALLMNEESDGYNDLSVYYMTLAAISDCRAATREATALQWVANALYSRGDMDRAYTYMMASMDDAVSSGARLRTLDVAEIVPTISKAYADRDYHTRVRLNAYIAVILVALIVIGFMLFRRLKAQNKLSEMKRQLAERNASKDDYIGELLSMFILYVDRLEDFNRLIGRKLKAGQTTELYNMIESGKILQEQTQQFHEVLDRAFIKMYPTFVDEVNSLLVPEKQISLPSPERLTPELRILAFLRLGIDDAAQIARFLGLSINTVYTYRNKTKLRALDRENFEQNVLKIGKID